MHRAIRAAIGLAIVAVGAWLVFGGGSAAGAMVRQSVNEGGLDLAGYCASMNETDYLNGPVQGPNAAFQWYCLSGSTKIPIVMNSACAWQYPNAKSVAANDDVNNAYSWSCFVQGGTSPDTVSPATHPAHVAAAASPTKQIPPAKPRVDNDRSTIASALTPFDKAFPLTWGTLINAAITIAAMLLLTFPAQLFNKTLDENYEDIRDVARRRLPALVAVRRFLRRHTSEPSSRLKFGVVMVMGTLLGGLNDPTFGFNVKSLETFVAVIACFLAGLSVTARIEREYRARRQLDTSWTLHALPAGLIVAAGCMIVSRAAHFEPGYLYGVIAGLAFTKEVGKRDQAVTVAFGTVTTLVVAVAAWIIWTPVNTWASHPHPVFVVLMADTFLGGLFVSGIVGTALNLVPLEFLTGATLIHWNKRVWAALMAVAMFLLIQVMVRPAARSSRLSDAPIVTTVVFFVAFAGLSIWFNRYMTARHHRLHPHEEHPEDDGAGTVLGASTTRVQPRA